MSKNYYDLVIVGGGTSGVFTAISSARSGLKVALIENSGMLGGTLTQVTLGGICGAWTKNSKQQVIHGLFDELLHVMRKEQACADLYTYGSISALPYEPIKMRLILDRLLPKSVDLYLHSKVYGINKDGGHIKSVNVMGAEGTFTIEGRVFIDATGSAVIANFAGTPTRRGVDGVVQAASSMFRIIGAKANPSNRDVRADIRKALEQHNSKHDNEFERTQVAVYMHPSTQLLHFNATRIHFDSKSQDPKELTRDLTRVEMEARRAAFRLIEVISQNVVGFENAEIVDMGSSVGIRDSRNIINDHPLTEEAIQKGIKPKNSIAYSAWPIEYHGTNSSTDWQLLDGDNYYGIPFETCMPQGVNNLLVAGRSISSTQLAQASARVTAPCIQMGESIGKAVHEFISKDMKSFKDLATMQFIE